MKFCGWSHCHLHPCRYHFTSVAVFKVVALGDEDNDIEMLEAVGHGVAMGQASARVRKSARYTAPTNTLDGVAVALETFCDI